MLLHRAECCSVDPGVMLVEALTGLCAEVAGANEGDEPRTWLSTVTQYGEECGADPLPDVESAQIRYADRPRRRPTRRKPGRDDVVDRARRRDARVHERECFAEDRRLEP